MICRVVSQDSLEWSEAIDVFVTTFPAATREPVEQIAEEVRGTWRLPYQLHVWMEGDRGLGMVRSCTLATTPAVYISHIAVREEARGQGIATALLEHVQHAPFVCEVEPGAPMTWWRNRGATTLTPTYTQPAMHADTEPVPFHLMVSEPPADPRTFIERFCSEVWQLPTDHRFVARALEGVE